MAISPPIVIAVILAEFIISKVALGGDGPTIARQDELVHLLRHDCGSCHGLTLKGGLGPPLLPEAMQAQDVATITAIIRDGVPGTPMPPWGGELSDGEIGWLAQQLLEGLPDAY